MGREHRLDNHITKVLHKQNNMEEVLVADDEGPDASVYMMRPMAYDAFGSLSEHSTAGYNRSQLQ